MGPALGDVLPLAAAVALFPIPVLAIILMLLSPRGATSVPAFLLGWVGGIVAIVAVAALLTGGVEEVADDAPEAIGWMRIASAWCLLLFGLKKWFGRPDANSDPEMPGWMSAIGDFSPFKALGVGPGTRPLLNPKNIALAASAGTAVGAPGLATAEAIAVGAVFTDRRDGGRRAAAALLRARRREGAREPAGHEFVAGRQQRARDDGADGDHRRGADRRGAAAVLICYPARLHAPA